MTRTLLFALGSLSLLVVAGLALSTGTISEKARKLHFSSIVVDTHDDTTQRFLDGKFDLGERAKVVILSVTEGEDKPLKYPHMFRAAEVMILNKTDLLPHIDFDVARAIANAREVNPEITVLQVSARSGDGLEGWYGWLRSEIGKTREAAFA